MKKYSIYILLLFSYCTTKIESNSEHNIVIPCGDSTEIVATLSLELIHIESNSKYPVGMGIRYLFKNKSKEKLFINFNPVFLINSKDGEKNFLSKNHDAIETIVPRPISLMVDSLQCSVKPKTKIIEQLYDSILLNNKGLQDEEIINEMYAKSFLFLDPGETYECVKSMTGLLISDSGFIYKGQYELLLLYDGAQQNVFDIGVPEVFHHYRRFKGRIVSNPIYFTIR